MLIKTLLLAIYLSFLMDFLVWPVPSEVSTAALVNNRALRLSWSNTLMISTQLIILVLWLMPLLNLAFWMQNDGSTFSQAIIVVGVGVALIGRTVTLVASWTIKTKGLAKVLSVSIFGVSRHPIVLGLHITLAGLLLTVQCWILFFPFLLSLYYFHQKIIREEENLLKRHGDAYTRYALSIPRYLFPRKVHQDSDNSR